MIGRRRVRPSDKQSGCDEPSFPEIVRQRHTVLPEEAEPSGKPAESVKRLHNGASRARSLTSARMSIHLSPENRIIAAPNMHGLAGVVGRRQVPPLVESRELRAADFPAGVQAARL